MSTKEMIVSILETKKGEYISGETIGKALNISRAAVSKVIKDLKTNGYTIYSLNKKGHCIPKNSNTLSLIEIQKNLKYSNKIKIKNIVDSTNIEAKRLLLENPSHGTVIISNEQTAGRAHAGRHFFSPKDSGIYMSIILNPDFFLSIEDSSKLITMTATSITETIEDMCKKKTTVKELNDIFLEDKKIGGVLTEIVSELESKCVQNIIIGVGINFNSINFPEHLSKKVGSIFTNEEPNINRNELISNIINSIMNNLDYLKRLSKGVDLC
ncbi:MAG: biotin--[acetyl-CoA-carboxylase] ligase [Fusobacteriaceae bacterium]